jgi:hypothetical protein
LSSLDKTCQSFDPRRDIGSEKFERGDCGNRYESGGDGVLRELKSGFVLQEVHQHDSVLVDANT